MLSMSVLSRFRKSKPLAITAVFALSVLVFGVLPTSAQSGAYDPYADAFVTPAPAVSDPTNAIGAPNSTIAKVAGTNSILTLDMGHGEEGTSTLKIYFRERNVKSINVAFLDGSQNVIASERRSLFISPGNSTQNFAYNWKNFGKAYRFVRITAPEGGSMGIDAIEALGYIGSTGSQDTDGDGITDREEQQQGTNPLAFNTNGSNTSSTTSGTQGGVSAQVNPPPEEDQDNDGVADTWETQFGLNPNEQADGGQDADADGLTNQKEYELGSNPVRSDTDGDGMPDKWEAENGLDINRADGDKDPDGDFFTNLGEFRYATDPNKADDLTNVFCGVFTRIKNQIIGWENFWWWFFALGALTGGLITYKLKRNRKSNRSKRPLIRK